jgi:alkanesulfonate monooxygenase SsuD/methylene tetrahydromethanopterin reductase-like flavin-dependent oxidoreductase (luciferase family)
VKAKLGVLSMHCDRVNRDPATLSKTRLGELVIAETDAKAHAKHVLLRERYGEGLGGAVVGTPASIGEQILPYFDAGLDGMIFFMHDAHDASLVRMAGAALIAATAQLHPPNQTVTTKEC